MNKLVLTIIAMCTWITIKFLFIGEWYLFLVGFFGVAMTVIFYKWLSMNESNINNKGDKNENKH